MNRTVLRWLPLVLPLALGACGGEPGDSEPDGGSLPVDSGPPPYDAGPFTRIPEAQAAAGREGCMFERGAMPWETIGEEFPIGRDIPVRHWFILMQENRSFDHYFGTMPGIDGIPGGVATNPNASGMPVETFHQTDYCTVDTGHGWNDGHRQWNGGANDGFVVDNEPDGRRAMGWYDDRDLPFYWDLYRTFAMSDHHFCSVMGPTWVNREYMLSASSFGLIGNDAIPLDRLEGEKMIYQQLDRAGVSWRIYFEHVPFVWGAYGNWALRPAQRARQREFTAFAADLASGDIADVTYIDPAWDFLDGVHAHDEHPHANIQQGQAWIREVITMIMASPIWQESAIILTYDEWGGFYDHVPPPEACHPGDYPAETGGAIAGDFDRLGFRVPLVVVSPWSRPGYVSDRVTDLSSIARLLQAAYLLPAMTGRDANAWPMLDMFDFTTQAFATPPELAAAPVDPARMAECEAEFPD
jgi:phospholipase C